MGLLVGVSTAGCVAVDVGFWVGVEVGMGVDATDDVGVAVRMVTVVTVPLSQPATTDSMTKTPAIDTTRTRGDTRITQPSWSQVAAGATFLCGQPIASPFT